VKRWTLSEIWARTPRIALASFLLFFLGTLIVGPCWADDASTKAAREVAQKLAAQIDHKKKALIEVVDLTGEMRVTDLDDAKRTIEAELHAHGVRAVADTSYETKIRITLSRDNVERLWIADYDSGGARAAVMVSFELTSLDLRSWITGAHLDRELVFTDSSPMLDFACTSSAVGTGCGEVLALHEDGVVFMALELNLPAAAVEHEKPWSRDVRGRLSRAGSDFGVRVEDVACSGNLNEVHGSKCAPTVSPWTFPGPRGEGTSAVLVRGQNAFEWVGRFATNGGRAKRDSFYSLAGLDVNAEPGWISSGIDGEVRIFTDKTGETVGIASGWGSELAAVKTDCGNGWQILATRQRDLTETDAITVYEWTGTEFRALSDPVEMNGTIVAMWSAQDGGPARAVVHNLKTGNYEAYLLKVGCSQ
jgi:hypothetical protein